jgi:putative sterol carrier protein
MLPFEIPAGTTLDTLFTDVLPKTHAKLVPAAAGTDRFVVVSRVVGFKSFTLEIRGAALTVREGEEAGATFWQVVARETAQRFLDDWLGEKRIAPAALPKGPLVSLSDPRILKRLSLVSGKVELALTDVTGGRMAMTAASGSAAKKEIHADDPDVVIEAPSSALTRLLEGKLSPEDALVDGAVTIRGKKLVAMQFALALAPFYPKG